MKTQPSANDFELALHHWAVSVPDLKASVAWYCDMLGFSMETEMTIDAVSADVAFLTKGDLRIELFEVTGALPIPDDRRYPNLDLRTHGTKHVALTVKDLRKVIDGLKRRGVEIAMDVTVVEHIEIGFIRDNTGNLIELVQQTDI